MHAVKRTAGAGDDLGMRLVEDETCVTELAILGLAEANSNFIGPAIRVWGPPPLQSYDKEGINKALRRLDCFLYTSQSNISHTHFRNTKAGGGC